jgi:hypothetical protein
MSNSPTHTDIRITRGRRLVVASVAMVIAAVGVAGIADAKSHKGGCPPSASPWLLNDGDQWKAASVDGLIAEFGTMQNAATQLDFSSVADLEKAIEWTFTYVDANEDGSICRSTTNPGGLPDYVFNVSDNRFNARLLTL